MIAFLWASAATADPNTIHTTARDIFARLPDLVVVDTMNDVCGHGRNINPNIGYCTTENIIYVSDAFAARPTASYEMAHVLGHAIQVRHGVADVAFRAIRARRSEEDALRGLVTRQVECVAGVLSARAGVAPTDLRAVFASEPFTGAHWGRRPLNVGPRVSIGLDARADWYDTGYGAADFAACTVGEMSADLIVQAAR